MLEVGQVVKPHGLRGEVVVALFTNRDERMEPGTVLATENGPLTIERSSPHLGRWIVTFSGVHSREDADALRGTILSAEPLDDPDELWVHELIDAEVVGVDGTRYGVVTAVEANPASDLLVLDSSGLVPLRFVVSSGDGRVVVDPPAGLLD
ncbi:MAG TPA: ribosome maturation factor RimM [Acidimicrobiales bacterium]|nr:ribosome maturation factor RimM [Acidimicrobiales bacterium]